MRLTGGADRGRRLRAPRGLGTRPTSARVREAIFNILGPPPAESVLDLYAGTGALGLEALSRSASRVVFVEKEPRALAALRSNIKALSLEQRAVVIMADVRTALRQLALKEERFAWVFADPPYASGEADAVLAELAGSRLLAPCAVVMVEHRRRHRPAASAGGLFLVDRRAYGDTEISFYRAGLS